MKFWTLFIIIIFPFIGFSEKFEENNVLFTLLDSYSKIRYDGYYQNTQVNNFEDKKSYRSQFIKFYPNGKLKYVVKFESQRQYKDWNSIKDYYTYSIKEDQISFEITDLNYKFWNGIFHSNGLIIYTRYHENGLTLRELFNFVKN